MTFLVTRDNSVYILNHTVPHYIADNDLRTLIKEIRSDNEISLDSTLLVSNMGVEVNAKDFDYVQLGSSLRELNLNLFPFPERKEYGYHAKI